MHNGLRSLPGRAVYRRTVAGYEPQWVGLVREPADTTFDATSGLYRDTPLVGQPATLTSGFFACRLRNPWQRQTRILWGYPDAASYGINISGGRIYQHLLGLGLSGGSGPRTSPGVFNPPYLMSAGQWARGDWSGGPGNELIYACSWDGTTGAMKGALFTWSWNTLEPIANTGGQGDIPVVYPTSNMPHDAVQWWLLGANYGYEGEVAWLWYHDASDGSAYVDVDSLSVRQMLEGDPEDFTFASPRIWFQGDAAEWNSGVNRGSGGDFVIGSNRFTDSPNVRVR